MKPLQERLLGALQPFVGSLVGGSVLNMAAKRVGHPTVDQVPAEQIVELVRQVKRGVATFVDKNRLLDACHRAIDLAVPEQGRLSMPTVDTEEKVIKISRELDLVLARAQAREWCQKLALPGRLVLVVLAVVSELVANLTHHAGGGELALRGPGAVDPLLHVIARDRGPGIDAERVTPSPGLGRGLEGVRRLAAEIEIRKREGGGTEIDVGLRVG